MYYVRHHLSKNYSQYLSYDLQTFFFDYIKLLIIILIKMVTTYHKSNFDIVA